MNTLSRTLASIVMLCFLVGGSVLFSGCENLTDFKEVNSNPNEPAEVPAQQQLSALLAAFSYEVVGNEVVRTPSLWVQQTAQNTDESDTRDSYQYDESDTNNLWNSFIYSGALKNAIVMTETAEASERPNIAGIGKIIQAWNWAILADLYDQAPLEEAFNEDITQPSYDSQERLYQEVFALLESARSDLAEPAGQGFSNFDFIYGGNAELWTKFAWALEAKMHIKLTESGYSAGLDGGSSRSDRAAAALAATQNGFDSNADLPSFPFFDEANAQNPWFQFMIEGVWRTDQQVSDNMITILKENQDPRLPRQARQAGAVNVDGLVPDFTPVEFDPSIHFDLADETYTGIVNGDGGLGVDATSSIGEYYSGAGADLVWMNLAEQKFIEAEARLITGNGSPVDAYEEGIRASLDQLNVTALANIDQAFVDNFVAERVAAYNDANNDEARLEAIINEKYVANFVRIEPFNDWRRTGYPTLSPVPEPQTDDGEIPKRFPWPNSEYNTNIENVPTGLGRGVTLLDEPVGWDK